MIAFKVDGINLKKAMARTKHKDLSEPVLRLLWSAFSNIQAAEWLVEDKPAVIRFCAWLESGNDEDAWS